MWNLTLFHRRWCESGFSDASLPQKVLSGEIDFFIEPTGRRCFKRDQNLDLFFYSDVAGEPYVTHLGAVKILGVFVFSGEGMASRLSPWLKVAGLDPARFFEALDRAQHFLKSGRRSVTLLRLQAVEGKRPAIPSAHIVHTRLTSAKIKDFLSQAKRARIIDLRGPQEVGENRITNAIETPYLVTSGQTKFDWRTTNQDTSFHKFEIAELLGTGRARNGVPIILVGDGPEDGRPIWALNVLNNVGVSHAFWFAEGASALKQAIAATNVTIDQ